MRFLSRFVDSNDRELRRVQPWVDQINALEPEYEAMAADDGITAHGSPTTTSPIEADPLKRADATVHELLALAQYFLVGGAPGTS